MQVLVVLPAFNEAGNLEQLLRDIASALSHRDHQVVVVNDGSSDGTADIANAWAETPTVKVVHHPQNAGLGKTLFDGLMMAVSLAQPEDCIVTMDADGSHRPEQIEELLAALEHADVVIASRYQHGSETVGVPGHRRLLSFGARRVGQAILGIPGVRDYTCGFRAFRAAVLQEAFARWGNQLITEPGFASTLELLLRVSRLKVRFSEIPMELRYDQKESTSKMRIVQTVRRTARVIGRHLAQR